MSRFTAALGRDILQWLAAGEPFALAMIVDHQGSAPRHRGSRMLVNQRGEICHSLGGGALEVETIHLARRALASGETLTRRFVLKGAQPPLGMLCGGEVEVLVQPLDPAVAGWSQLYGALAELFASRQQGWLITRVGSDGGQWLLREDAALTGVGHLTAEERRLLTSSPPNPPTNPLTNASEALLTRKGSERIPDSHLDPSLRRHCPLYLTGGASRFLCEPLSPPATLTICGAGHVGQQLALLASQADFQVRVLDDRPEFARRERFPAAVEEVLTLPSYDQALTGRTLDGHSLLVILTQGHASDWHILRQALGTAAGYIGMIGSHRKWDTLHARLRAEGFSVADLERVRCPIGLAIGAETPLEIAVSILAELIQFRASHLSVSSAVPASSELSPKSELSPTSEMSPSSPASPSSKATHSCRVFPPCRLSPP